MKKWILGLLVFFISVVTLAEDIKITGQNGNLTIDNGTWQYTFRTKDNLLTSVAESGGGPNLLTDVRGGGGHWIYVTGSGEANDPKRIFRQGESPSTASYQILYVDQSRAVIRFVTILDALRIEDVYTVGVQTGFVKQAFEIEAVKTIPNLTLLTWQTKLGASGKQAEPFDWFCWGPGVDCIVRNEDKLTTGGTLQKPGVKVDIRKATSVTYWIRPKSMNDKFISMLSREHNQFWLLAFSDEDNSPWYFFGDRGIRFNYSTWFGFRVFGDTIYAKKMPTFSIEKGTKWTGSVCHILAEGDSPQALTKAYNNWKMKNNTERMK